ncbi:UI [Merluccius polli]|uniref:UI n=1 Tax=Merluccius polli TaxID=89951 RepID=A0AA47M8T9_MERPO|nr:UI [Merluccius polli]
MKPVPLVLLLASVLLAAHVRPYAGRPRTPPAAGLDASGRYKSRLDEVLAAAPADGAVSYLLGDKLLHVLQRTRPHGALLWFPIAEEPAADGEALLSHLARGLASLETELRAPAAAEGNSLDELVGLSKRNDDPPISIDLTFHLLRNMIEMAKIESQKEQAELNRKFLDEVGK